MSIGTRISVGATSTAASHSLRVGNSLACARTRNSATEGVAPSSLFGGNALALTSRRSDSKHRHVTAGLSCRNCVTAAGGRSSCECEEQFFQWALCILAVTTSPYGAPSYAPEILSILENCTSAEFFNRLLRTAASGGYVVALRMDPILSDSWHAKSSASRQLPGMSIRLLGPPEPG